MAAWSLPCSSRLPLCAPTAGTTTRCPTTWNAPSSVAVRHTRGPSRGSWATGARSGSAVQRTAYCLGVEKLLGITDQVPARASTIRLLMMELKRVGCHLVALGASDMEMGATTVMTIGFRERERILTIFEMITGFRSLLPAHRLSCLAS